MLKIKTTSQLIKCNLRDYEVEKTFKEVALNHVIDQTEKKLLLRFCHADHDTKVGEEVLDTKEVLRIDFAPQKYYEQIAYYSIQDLITEKAE